MLTIENSHARIGRISISLKWAREIAAYLREEWMGETRTFWGDYELWEGIRFEIGGWGIGPDLPSGAILVSRPDMESDDVWYHGETTVNEFCRAIAAN